MKRLAVILTVVCALFAQNTHAQGVYGEMKLHAAQGFLLAETAMPNGDKAWFAVDLAVATTAVTKSYAANASIEMMRSSNDPLERTVYRTALGGFGTATEIVGKATMKSMDIGGLRFEDARVVVMDSAPEIAGRPIAGIMGVDMLRRAEIALFVYGDNPRLLMKSKARKDMPGTIEAPMKLVNDHVFIEGTLNGQKVDFLLDTGSPDSYLPVKSVRATGAAAKPNSTRSVMTLEGESMKVREAEVNSFAIGGTSFSDIAFQIAELPVFGTLPESSVPVLLGNNFFSAMKFVQIHFEENTVRLKLQ